MIFLNALPQSEMTEYKEYEVKCQRGLNSYLSNKDIFLSFCSYINT